MSPLAIASIAFACVLAGTLGGMYLRSALPDHHLSDESKEVVKLGIGMIATMTALILGLMTASAKSAFDAQNAAIEHMAANVLALDRALASYGPETRTIRTACARRSRPGSRSRGPRRADVKARLVAAEASSAGRPASRAARRAEARDRRAALVPVARRSR